MSNRAKRRHKALRVRVGGQQAMIDEPIAPLIREIWRAGIETVMSCQEDGWGRIWIEFGDVQAGQRFLNMVAQYESGVGNLYHRMHPRWSSDDDSWWYEVHVNDFALQEDPFDEKSVGYEGPSDFYFAFCVRFPPADLPEVIRRLQEYNYSRMLNRAASARHNIGHVS
ncbi:MAG TPA: hypothetical protein VGG64_11835 [Pirellulales bacterium]